MHDRDAATSSSAAKVARADDEERVYQGSARSRSRRCVVTFGTTTIISTR